MKISPNKLNIIYKSRHLRHHILIRWCVFIIVCVCVCVCVCVSGITKPVKPHYWPVDIGIWDCGMVIISHEFEALQNELERQWCYNGIFRNMWILKGELHPSRFYCFYRKNGPCVDTELCSKTKPIKTCLWSNSNKQVSHVALYRVRIT